MTWVLKRQLLWIPVFGWALAMIRPIAIDRAAGRAALEQLVSQGTSRLDEGISVAVFPEGTRVPPGEKRRYKVGGALLAQRSGRPVVPVALNTGYFWPKGQFVKYPGEIVISIGPVIATRDKTPEAILAEAEAWIEGRMPALLPPQAGQDAEA